MLGFNMNKDDQEQTKEMAAKKVMQQILADQYKSEIEKKKVQRDHENHKNREDDRMSVQQMVHATEPSTILAQFKDAQSTASGGDMRWRQKGTGDLNFDARMIAVNKKNQPNLVRDAFIRDQQRKVDVQKYYQDIKAEGEREKQEKIAKKNQEIDWEKRFVSRETNIFQKNYDREQAKKEEVKRNYADELKRQYELDQEKKKNFNRMTQTEKRLNYENLQVFQINIGLQILGSQQLCCNSWLGRKCQILQTTIGCKGNRRTSC